VAPTASDALFLNSGAGAALSGTVHGLSLNVSGAGDWVLQDAVVDLSGAPASAQPIALQDSGRLTLSGGTLLAGGSSDVGAGTALGATMTAAGGAQVTFRGTSLGSNAGETGSLVITGSSTTGVQTSWQNVAGTLPVGSEGSLDVGVAAATATQAGGVGHATITAGASVVDSAGDIVGVNAGSKGDLSVTAGGTLKDNGLTIGLNGTGTLTVTAATVTTSGPSAIGANAGGTGTATVSGGGVWTTAQNLTVGGAGSGRLTIDAGSSVDAASASVGASGVIGLAGGTFSASTLTLGAGATLSGSGTVLGSIDDNGVIAATGLLTLSGAVGGTGSLRIGAGATLDVSTTATGDAIAFLGGTGVLVARQAGTIGAAISGYGVGDTIDLRSLTFAPGATATIAAGVLTVASGAASETLRLSGIGDGSSFSASADAAGTGTDIGIVSAVVPGGTNVPPVTTAPGGANVPPATTAPGGANVPPATTAPGGTNVPPVTTAPGGTNVPPASAGGALTPNPLNVFDTSTGQSVSAVAQPYTGPVSGLQEQYINITADNLNISVSTPDWFIHSGSGTDAIAVNGGTNVLDGGTGSNFLTGGSGADTFFVDDRGPTADIWSTVVGFHAGDSATIWGVAPQDFGLAWADGQGAAGFTGLTLHATAAGKPTASLTLAGYSQADITDGRLSVSFGTDPASGSAFMFVHGNG
jgi:T5SS/PEP-CTERM-associated repeat protein